MFDENKNTELETTKELEELSDLNNQILEVKETPIPEEKGVLEEQQKEEFFTKPKKVKLKEKIKNWWKKLGKKERILVIIGIVLFVVLLVVGIVFLVRAFTKKPDAPAPKEVIVQEENYRYENGVLVFLNSAKEEIGRYICENQNEELCFVSYYSTEDDFDVEKKVYESGSPVLTRSAIVEDTFVFVNDNPKKETELIKLYNIKEQMVKNTFKNVKRVEKNKFILKNENSLYGIVEIANNELVTKLDFTYTMLAFVPNSKNVYISTQNDRNFLIDETGKNLSKAITGAIKNANEKYVKVKNQEGKYEVYNYNNQKIFNESFDYVELFDDYAVLIQDTKMFLKFYDKNKLNEEGIQLNNKEYVKTSIYDEANTLKETKESFTIEENNDIITINILNAADSKVVQVNKAEGNTSKSLRNMNYFDGKIYIYSNTEKTNLLGSYTCANKNSGGSLKNCKIAHDTIFEDNDYEIPGSSGAIPIFNERFVFISDNPDLVNDSNKTIVLYDLKKNTSIGKYRNVNTYSYTGTDDITFSTVTDLQVVAENQSGNFGVLKINLSEVKGHINFNYSSMERLRDYYVAKAPHGYLLVDKNTGSESSSSIDNKIRNYNKEYVKVKDNQGNYYIYRIQDMQGKRINDGEFKYIELYDDFFAGVNNNNQLGVYTYKNPKQNIISGGELLPLNSKNYYGNGVLAFKIDGIAIAIDNVSTGKYVQIPVEEN